MNYDQKVYQQINQGGTYATSVPKYMQATYTDPGPGRSSQGDNAKPPVRGKTSPYGFFVKMCYEEHKKKYPNENVQVTEISKKCSEKWKTMTDDEKRRFFELAQKDAERYQAEVAAYGGEDAMKKKKKKMVKDPNAPKRALSAFFIFSNEKRQDVQQHHPEWKVGQVAQELGRVWKELTPDEKSVYENKAAVEKGRYAEEMKNYQDTKTTMAQQQQQNMIQQHHQQQQMVVTDMPMQIHHMMPQMHNNLGQM